jgi:UPF0716 family protein affecting phage T7 exclusion
MKRLIWNRQTKRLAKHIFGWICIVLGMIMLITPGQGLLTIILGIYLLADQVPFFGRLRDRLNRRFPKITAYANKKQESLNKRFHHKTDSDS